MASLRTVALLISPLLVACGPEPADVPVDEGAAYLESASDPSRQLLDHPAWEETIGGFEEQLLGHVAQDGVGGLAVGVVVEGELVWERGLSWADREGWVRATSETAFRVGSISRTVTAILLLRLVDQGVVGLDDPVEPYLAELARVDGRRPDDPPVTFRHLASHTAGLARNYEVGLAGDPADWQERVAHTIEQLTFGAEPGSQHQDSPIGYAMLGLALERAAGRPFIELTETEVFSPLGMTDSWFGLAAEGRATSVAVSYPNKISGGVVAETAGRGRFGGGGYALPSGGMFSTVSDLSRLLGAIAGVPELDILSDASRAELLAVQTPGGLHPPRMPGQPPTGPRPALFRDGTGGNVRSPEVLDPPQSLGLSIDVDREDHTIVHAGGIADGYTAYMAVDPESGIGVVMLRNYWRGMTDMRDGSIGLVQQLNELALGRGTTQPSLGLPLWVWALSVVLLALALKGVFGREPGVSRHV